MKKYTLCIPLIANVYISIEAENENEAWEIGQELYDKGEIDFEGYDSEPVNLWELNEE